MVFRTHIKKGTPKIIYNLISCGFNIPEAASKLGINVTMANRLFEYEYFERKKHYTSILLSVEDKPLSFAEMKIEGNCSYTDLYKYAETEHYLITKKSKV